MKFVEEFIDQSKLSSAAVDEANFNFKKGPVFLSE
jgi:hypothetical protein